MIELFKIFLKQIRDKKLKGATLKQFKYFFIWEKSLSPNRSSMTDEQPWITFDAIKFLEKTLTSNSVVFEYGGGGSTLFFVKRAKEVITVEHDREWYENVKKILENKQVRNWEGYLITPELGKLASNPALSSPSHYTSEAESFKEYNFKTYASKIDDFDDEYFDFVLIDGRSRPACVKHSIPKITKGGFLILDNSDREYYVSELQQLLNDGFSLVLNNAGASPYSRTFTMTSIWQKR
jgi:hypothetical protein